MTETYAVNEIKTVLNTQSLTYEIKVINRKFSGLSRYTAFIGVIAKEGLIDTALLKALKEMFVNEGSGDFNFDETQIDMKNLSYDVLVIQADIKEL